MEKERDYFCNTVKHAYQNQYIFHSPSLSLSYSVPKPFPPTPLPFSTSPATFNPTTFSPSLPPPATSHLINTSLTLPQQPSPPTLHFLASIPDPHISLTHPHSQPPSLHQPDAVEDIAVGEDPDVGVGEDDVVEVACLLVLEKQVRHPDFVRLRQCQVFDATCREGGKEKQ